MRADRQRAQLTFDPGVPEVPPPRGWPDGFAGGGAERGALLVLASMRGIRPIDLHALAWKEGSPAGCVAAIRSGHAGSDGDRVIADELDPAEVEAALAACGARLVAPGSPEYLPGFLDLRDPPVALFVEGSSMNQLGTCVAVVGARNCTPAGRDLAHDVGAGLGAAGVTVVSGAARGIDRAAHEGALDAGGPSVAVLGCGIDIAYPRGSRKVIARCRERGALVSEYPPGVPPEPHRFPARNRLIAGLASDVVLVEGVTDSGSLITAGHALDIGRQVFAVPGSVTSPLAGGPLAAIRDGAVMIRGSEDLLEDLGLADVRTRPEPSELAATERRVLEALNGPTLPEAVAAKVRVALPDVLALLLELEVRGLVRSRGGRYELRSSGAAGASLERNRSP